MSKIKKAFFCQNCGAEFPQWKGQCVGCKKWNTLIEEVYQKEKKTSLTKKSFPISLEEVSTSEEKRIQSFDEEFDRILGGGIVPGSVILIGGEPGIGKSTLFLQLALRMKGKKILYVTGEESYKQIKLRADRISTKNPTCFLLNETQSTHILKKASELHPCLIIIDSIQTLESSFVDSPPGSVSQIRESSSELINFAKSTTIPILLIGHITKDGNLAGPKVLEHMVDVVLQFEGDSQHIYRILRSKKNRFGSTSELGIYQMKEDGLAQIKNPSELLIYNKENRLSGNAIAVCMEGLRPILLEVQALVGAAVYGTPQRSSTGFDLKRLHMLLAVLEKRAGFPLKIKDIFVNITGGIKIEEPALDLSILASVISSFRDLPIKNNACFCAEVGLSGEMRPINRIESRIKEAQKLGFERIFISSYHKLASKSNIEIVKVSTIGELLQRLF